MRGRRGAKMQNNAIQRGEKHWYQIYVGSTWAKKRRGLAMGLAYFETGLIF